MIPIFKNHLYFIITIIISALVVAWFILISNGNYGTTLFFTIPASIGFLIGYSNRYNGQTNKKTKTIIVGFLKISVILASLTGILIALGMEGAICILMAFPFLVIPMFVAYLLGVFIASADSKNKINSIIFILIINPTTYIYDGYIEPINEEIKTEIIINTSKEEIWKDLSSEIEFKNKPNLLFKKGVTFPKSIQLQNKNEELIYNCITNTIPLILK